jgi:hypothetical protein
LRIFFVCAKEKKIINLLLLVGCPNNTTTTNII